MRRSAEETKTGDDVEPQANRWRVAATGSRRNHRVMSENALPCPILVLSVRAERRDIIAAAIRARLEALARRRMTLL
jgi:hypothetical protein